MNIHILDLQFLDTKHTIASFLIDKGDSLTLVETGPHSTFPHLKQGLNKLGYQPADIDQVLLTHIHLDHAGAAWAFAREGARIYVHPFGLRHLNAPEKLMYSARRIYREEMDRLWGEMHPISEDHLQAVSHEALFDFGEQAWTAWHTPGHAVHHIAWQLGDVIFTGDVAGVRIGDGIVVPPCPPPDIDLDAWLMSIGLLRKLAPSALYLTHFGRIDDVMEHLDQLEKRLVEWADWMRPYYEKGASVEEITPIFQKYVKEELVSKGVSGKQLIQYEYANPSWMSVAGLLRYWRKKLTRDQ